MKNIFLAVAFCVSCFFGSIASAQTLPPSEVHVTWNANIDHAVGYKLYYGTETGVYSQKIDVGNATNFSITGLTHGLTYYLVATAYDIDGNESDYSVEVSGPAKYWLNPNTVEGLKNILHIPGNTVNIFIGPQ